eukprot:4905854-Amphidinium_carterae.1
MLRVLVPCQEYSNIVWSYATLTKTAERLFRRTAPRVVETIRELDSQHLANIAWAYAKISHRDDGLFYVLSREAMQPQRQVNPLNLANFGWAFANAGSCPWKPYPKLGLKLAVTTQWLAVFGCWRFWFNRWPLCAGERRVVKWVLSLFEVGTERCPLAGWACEIRCSLTGLHGQRWDENDSKHKSQPCSHSLRPSDQFLCVG